MFKRAIWALAAVVCFAAPSAVRAQGDYLDVYMVKVKPEKLADFQALSKKWVDANRRFNGDHWITTETMYGEGNVYSFVSPRQDYADIDKANEVRRRRFDLSRKPPTDMASYAKLVGESRVVRTTAVHIRPGHVADFEALMKETKEASEKAPNTQPLLVAQVVEGTKGTTFYITSLRTSLGGFDKNPTIRDILGEEGYKKFLQVNADSVESTESALFRFSPELSNPADEIVQVAADFWHPKTVMAAAASKPKAATAKTPELKPTAEKPKQ